MEQAADQTGAVTTAHGAPRGVAGGAPSRRGSACRVLRGPTPVRVGRMQI